MKVGGQITLGIFALVIGFANVPAPEKAVTMKDLPAAVRRTVQEQSQGAAIRGLSKEVEAGKTVYEVDESERSRQRRYNRRLGGRH